MEHVNISLAYLNAHCTSYVKGKLNSDFRKANPLLFSVANDVVSD